LNITKIVKDDIWGRFVELCYTELPKSNSTVLFTLFKLLLCLYLCYVASECSKSYKYTKNNIKAKNFHCEEVMEGISSTLHEWEEHNNYL